MILVGQRKISKFARKHPNAKASLERWVVLITENDFDSFPDLTSIFPSADYVKPYTVFNVSGNNFRLIAEISYLEKTIIIYSILTHSEYDKEMWKNEY
jgi:mRNA interferase HigB